MAETRKGVTVHVFDSRGVTTDHYDAGVDIKVTDPGHLMVYDDNSKRIAAYPSGKWTKTVVER